MTETFWILLVFFLFADIAVAVVRAALVHARLPALINLRSDDPQGVDRTLKFMDTPGLRETLRAGLVVMHFFVAGMAVMVIERLNASPPGLVLSFGVIIASATVILFCEFFLEGAVHQHAERWAVRLTPLGMLVDLLFRPAAWLFSLLQPPSAEHQHPLGAVSEDELKTWAEAEQGEGALEIDERKMIYSIFHFSNTLCREIMVPRIDVSALEISTSLPDAIREIHRSGHSRMPVYEDVIDNIIGILYAKDLLKVGLEMETAEPVRNYLRKAYFVPEAKKVDELLREMQANGVHISVVIDEYGGMAGLVTLEDIVEEIVGEIRDEYDQSEELPYQQVAPDEFLIQGRIDLDALNEIINTHFTRESAETLGGFIYSELGHIPAEGEKVEYEDWQFTVEQVTKRRIRLVHAEKKPVIIPQEE